MFLFLALIDLFYQFNVQPDEAVKDEKAIEADECVDYLLKHTYFVIFTQEQDRDANCAKKQGNEYGHYVLCLDRTDNQLLLLFLCIAQQLVSLVPLN